MKNKKLTIRITNFEKRQLAQEAERRGMTQSDLIRSLIARFPVRVAEAVGQIRKTLCKIHPTPMLRIGVG
ncbi:CopG family transcriptional regulator [Moorena bouillonii]|uniref:ribbon-helix-helix domain-containing protein n=1 Tax=Moorena bouillonii TaxID=207920 RepID=UPI00268531F7